MAKARAIVKRRKAVTNIRKITRTMQLIATARFQSAFKRATASQPYTKKITEMVAELSRHAGGQVEHALMRPNPDAAQDVLLVITSNRGFCGGYNSNVIQTAVQRLRADEAAPHELHVVGKKGIAYFRFLRREIHRRITEIDDRPRFEQIDPIATDFMRRYEDGALRGVYVAYMRFISTGKQAPEIIRLLPLSADVAADVAADAPAAAHAGPSPRGPSVQYEFSPPPAELLKVLLPQTVKVRLYQCFTDAAVSEQVARMVAMKSATDAAGETIKILSRQFNRARQTQITMELLDIVGGAEVLK